MKNYNLFEFTELVKSIAAAHPFVNDFRISRYSVNESDNINYPVIALTINSITIKENTQAFDFNILFADRLTEQRDNEITAQTTGISTIIEILNAIKEHTTIDIDDNYILTPFTEQFADNCAGVFARVSSEVPNYLGECTWIDPKCIKCK